MIEITSQPGTTPYQYITRYTVNCLPEDDIEASHWAITVEYRGRNLWAVLHGPYCLSKSGDWDYEMRPSEREDDWLAEHRFSLVHARQLAQEQAPVITVNGLTAAGLLEWRARNHAEVAP